MRGKKKKVGKKKGRRKEDRREDGTERKKRKREGDEGRHIRVGRWRGEFPSPNSQASNH